MFLFIFRMEVIPVKDTMKGIESSYKDLVQFVAGYHRALERPIVLQNGSFGDYEHICDLLQKHFEANGRHTKIFDSISDKKIIANMHKSDNNGFVPIILDSISQLKFNSSVDRFSYIIVDVGYYRKY